MGSLNDFWSRVEFRYVLVGIWNTFFAFLAFAFFATSFENTWSLTQILTVASAIGITQSYATQKKFVWKSKNKISGEFTRFLVVSIAQYFANLLLLQIMIVWFGFPLLPSQLVITAILIALTFVGLKLWVFRAKTNSPAMTFPTDAS
jgi:putative flippase GtrA